MEHNEQATADESCDATVKVALADVPNNETTDSTAHNVEVVEQMAESPKSDADTIVELTARWKMRQASIRELTDKWSTKMNEFGVWLHLIDEFIADFDALCPDLPARQS